LRLAALAAAGVMMAAGAGAAPHGGHRGFKPGHTHPDLWLPDTEGKVRKLSDFGGAKLLIFHFASW
jgi:hypothetical protein